MMCGIDEEGIQPVSGTYAEDLRELETGINLVIPNDFPDRDSPNATRSIILQVNEPTLSTMPVAVMVCLKVMIHYFKSLLK